MHFYRKQITDFSAGNIVGLALVWHTSIVLGLVIILCK